MPSPFSTSWKHEFKKIWTTLAFFIFFGCGYWIQEYPYPLLDRIPDLLICPLYNGAGPLTLSNHIFFRRSSVCLGPNPGNYINHLIPLPPTPHSLSFPMHRHDPCLIPLPYPTIILPLPFPRLGRVHRANHVSPLLQYLSFALLI
jgi:hypothetical protein